MAVQPKKSIAVSFDEAFVHRDQDVADLANPRPETRFCLMELPKEELEALEAGSFFRLQTHSAGGAALCTGTKTFAIEFLENSNSLFVGFPKDNPPPKDDQEAKPPEEVETNKENQASENKPENSKQPENAEASKQEAAPVVSATCKLFGQIRGQMFLKPVNGDITRLTELLSGHAVKTTEDSSNASQVAPVKISTLEYEVAASNAEIRSFLEQGPYVENKGAWKLLPQSFSDEVLDIALTSITANAWDKSAVNGCALLTEVQNHLGQGSTEAIPTVAVLRKIMQVVIASPCSKETEAKDGKEKAKSESTPAESTDTTKDGTESDKPDPNIIALDVDKVNLFQALQILHSSPAKLRREFELPPPPPRAKRARVSGMAAAGAASRDPPLLFTEFVKVFRAKSGLDMSEEATLNMLGDRVLYDEIEGTVQTLDTATLPQDAKARLKKLFELQLHWRPEKLAKIMAPALANQKIDPWLMKWARTVFIEIEAGKGEARMLTRKFAGI